MAKKSWNNLKKFYSSNFIESNEILIRCGRYLEKIDLRFLKSPICILPIIAYHCPNIRSITCNKASVEGLKNISENCRNITELRINEFEVVDELDGVLGALFSNNKKLQVLDILGYKGNGNCLLKLPFEEITTIKIPNLKKWASSEQKIINLIEKSKKLSILHFKTINANAFIALANNFRFLTELTLNLDNDSDIDDIDRRLSQIFENNENLKSIKLKNFGAITGECFLYLNKDTIEEIHPTIS